MKIGTLYHSTDDTPPDLAALGHPPQRGGREPDKFQFPVLLTKDDIRCFSLAFYSIFLYNMG